MDINDEIKKLEDNIQYYQRMLALMPKDTLLGRLCIEAYIKRDTRKLKKLIEKKNNSNV